MIWPTSNMTREQAYEQIRFFCTDRLEVQTNSCVSAFIQDHPDFKFEPLPMKIRSMQSDPYLVGTLDNTLIMVNPLMPWSETVIYSKSRLDKIKAGFMVMDNEGVLDLRDKGIDFI